MPEYYGDFIMVNGHEALVIERDNLQGSAAAFKRIYLVDLRDADQDGWVSKRLLVDLMQLANPRGLSPTATRSRSPMSPSRTSTSWTATPSWCSTTTRCRSPHL